MIKALLALALAAATLPALAAQTVKATVNGMVCAFCAQGIEKTIAKMDATKAVHVDLKRKLVLVEPKEGNTIDQAAVKSAIVDAGYDVVTLEVVPQTLDELKAAAGAKVKR